jgi:hypothetical protein
MSGIPAFTVLNQLNLTNPHDGGGAALRLFSVGISALMGRFRGLSDDVLLPTFRLPTQ